jgi:predicted NUDIX family NTP pyrophosphohydrolase
MPRKKSAGVLLYRRRRGAIEVLLVHPGGPFWRNRDDGAWSIPKGEFDDDEAAEAAARREFEEETGVALEGELVPLAPARQKGGKTIHAFALERDLDPATFRSNTFEIEWPPASGKLRAFPEVDRAEWFPLPRATQKILDGQRPILIELEGRLDDESH